MTSLRRFGRWLPSARVVQGALALVLIVVGVALFSVPCALIVAGVLLLVDRLT